MINLFRSCLTFLKSKKGLLLFGSVVIATAVSFQNCSRVHFADDNSSSTTGLSVTGAGCSAPTVPCQIGQGLGTQTCTPDANNNPVYGVCQVTSCTTGFAFVGGTCISEACTPTTTQVCTIMNGAGVMTCSNVGQWGDCENIVCNAGYYLTTQAGQPVCLADYTTVLAQTPSFSSVNNNGNVAATSDQSSLVNSTGTAIYAQTGETYPILVTNSPDLTITEETIEVVSGACSANNYAPVGKTITGWTVDMTSTGVALQDGTNNIVYNPALDGIMGGCDWHNCVDFSNGSSQCIDIYTYCTPGQPNPVNPKCTLNGQPGQSLCNADGRTTACLPICTGGQVLIGSTCGACPAGTAYDSAQRSCDPIVCPNGQVLVGNTCTVTTCSNSAINPPACNTCSSGSYYNGTQCVTDICTPNAVDTSGCMQPTNGSSSRTCNSTGSAYGACTATCGANYNPSGTQPNINCTLKTCSNGGLVYPACNTCASGQYYDGTKCVVDACTPNATSSTPCTQPTNGSSQATCNSTGSAYGTCTASCSAGYHSTGTQPNVTCAVNVCTNGATNYPGCNVCDSAHYYSSVTSSCVLQQCAPNSLDTSGCAQPANGSSSRTCLADGSGYGTCTATCGANYNSSGSQPNITCTLKQCTNGATNYPACNACGSGQYYSGSACVADVCTPNSSTSSGCLQPSGGTAARTCNSSGTAYGSCTTSCPGGYLLDPTGTQCQQVICSPGSVTASGCNGVGANAQETRSCNANGTAYGSCADSCSSGFVQTSSSPFTCGCPSGQFQSGNSCVAQVIGQVGSANGGNYSSPPTSGLCAVGTPSNVSSNGSNYFWTCTGNNGGATAVNGSASQVSCGSSNGQSLTSPPTYLCTSGVTSPLSGSGPWSWTCTGSSGGSPIACSASRTIIPMTSTTITGFADTEQSVGWRGSASYSCNGNGNGFMNTFATTWFTSSNDHEGYTDGAACVVPSAGYTVNSASTVLEHINVNSNTWGYNESFTCPAGYGVNGVSVQGIQSGEQEAHVYTFTCAAPPNGIITLDSTTCNTVTGSSAPGSQNGAGVCQYNQYIAGVHIYQTQNTNNLYFNSWDVTCCTIRNANVAPPVQYTTAQSPAAGVCWYGNTCQTQSYATPALCQGGMIDKGVSNVCGNPNQPNGNATLQEFQNVNHWGCPSGYVEAVSVRTCVAPGTPAVSGGGGGGGGGASGGGCFVEGTQVTMADGSRKSIESVQVGEKVLMYSDKDHVEKVSEVITLHHHPARLQNLHNFEFANGNSLVSNDIHPIYIVELDQYIQASEIYDRVMNRREKLSVMLEDGSATQITKISVARSSVPVYNLSIKGDDGVTFYVDRGSGHTYFANGVLVHNAAVQKN